MFKLIGIIVFVVVLVVGFPSLMRWYSGDATPKETVEEIRGKLSDKLATDKNGDEKTNCHIDSLGNVIDIKTFSVDVQAVESGLCFRVSGLSMEAA